MVVAESNDGVQTETCPVCGLAFGYEGIVGREDLFRCKGCQRLIDSRFGKLTPWFDVIQVPSRKRRSRR